ncbi:MAG: hypothetical protein JNM07_07410 [Phycisphaerae bacterium]|nr:hypothetical protein [Phycisphaerae bacterium]
MPMRPRESVRGADEPGRGWALVGSGAGASDLASRRDADLNVGARDGARLATSEWPEAAPPSLLSQRRIYLDSRFDSGSQLYFVPRDEWSRRGHGWREYGRWGGW